MQRHRTTDLEFEISPKAAKDFDRMLSLLCQEVARQEFDLVAAAQRGVERAERGGTPLAVSAAQEQLHKAAQALAARYRRVSLCFPSSRVTCGKPDCDGHQALFVGVA